MMLCEDFSSGKEASNMRKKNLLTGDRIVGCRLPSVELDHSQLQERSANYSNLRSSMTRVKIAVVIDNY